MTELSLSTPLLLEWDHTSRTALCMCVYACLLACLFVWTNHYCIFQISAFHEDWECPCAAQCRSEWMMETRSEADPCWSTHGNLLFLSVSYLNYVLVQKGSCSQTVEITVICTQCVVTVAALQLDEQMAALFCMCSMWGHLKLHVTKICVPLTQVCPMMMKHLPHGTHAGV